MFFVLFLNSFRGLMLGVCIFLEFFFLLCSCIFFFFLFLLIGLGNRGLVEMGKRGPQNICHTVEGNVVGQQVSGYVI